METGIWNRNRDREKINRDLFAFRLLIRRVKVAFLKYQGDYPSDVPVRGLLG
jgi:hypothetical protein